MNNEITYRVRIDTTIKDGRCIYNLSTPTDQPQITLNQITSILSGALSLSIRGSENEAQTMRDVINYLNEEFVSIDSFKDLEVKVKKWKEYYIRKGMIGQ